MFRLGKIWGMVLLSQLALAAPSWSVEVGEQMPDFALQTLAGNKITRTSLVGKPTLIVFWNTWCSKCRQELPRLSRVAERLSPKGLTVLAINTGLNDSESKARTYWKKYGYRFPAAFDCSFEVGQSFGVTGVPTVLLVDSKGTVRYKSPDLPEDMEERFRQLGGK